MTNWIIAGLGLFFVQSMLAPMIRWLGDGGTHLRDALGPRDDPPTMPRLGARLDRAFHNLIEAMFLFVPLTLLAEVKGLTAGLAVQGAALFLAARIAYVPAYASGIPGLRSLIWMIGHAGLLMILLALI